MKYYLLSDQDIDEIIWDVENFIYELREKLVNKEIKPDSEVNQIPPDEF